MSDLIQLSEKIRDHLTQQRRQSMASLGPRRPSCAYRGENGAMCAVGCLIKDEFYSVDIERASPENDRVNEALANSLGVPLTYDMVNLFLRWQAYHDYDYANMKYSKWIEGDEPHSPSEMHNLIVLEIKAL